MEGQQDEIKNGLKDEQLDVQLVGLLVGQIYEWVVSCVGGWRKGAMDG